MAQRQQERHGWQTHSGLKELSSDKVLVEDGKWITRTELIESFNTAFNKWLAKKSFDRDTFNGTIRRKRGNAAPSKKK